MMGKRKSLVLVMLVASNNFSRREILRIWTIAKYWNMIPSIHANVKSNIYEGHSAILAIVIPERKTLHSLITSHSVHPAPQWVAETNIVSQNGFFLPPWVLIIWRNEDDGSSELLLLIILLFSVPLESWLIIQFRCPICQYAHKARGPRYHAVTGHTTFIIFIFCRCTLIRISYAI